jgi:hypothetical protein
LVLAVLTAFDAHAGIIQCLFALTGRKPPGQTKLEVLDPHENSQPVVTEGPLSGPIQSDIFRDKDNSNEEGAQSLTTDESSRYRRMEDGVPTRPLNPHDTRQFSITEASVKNLERTLPEAFQSPQDIQRDGTNSFVIAGYNPTERIQDVTTVNGKTFQQLTNAARGTHSTTGNPHQSEAGFITASQDVKSVMVADNVTVTEGFRMTHQQVAAPLLQGMKALESLNPEYTGPLRQFFPEVAARFIFNGQEYRIQALAPGGSNSYTQRKLNSGWGEPNTMGTIFNDSVYANYEFRITRSDGKHLVGTAITPHMIYRYGFYQGGAYRMDPKKIITFFGFNNQ